MPKRLVVSEPPHQSPRPPLPLRVCRRHSDRRSYRSLRDGTRCGTTFPGTSCQDFGELSRVAIFIQSLRDTFRIQALLAFACFAYGVSPICQAADSQTPSPSEVRQTAEPRVLRGGWYPWDPYQYRENARGNETLTGFDVEIERAVARVMGVELLLPEISWGTHLAGLSAGTRDIAAGATYSSQRDEYAYFSKPYRRETDVLILLRGTSSKYPFETVDQMLDFFQKQHFRLGTVTGFAYADQRINAYISDPANAALVIKEDNDLTNLENLLQGRIDGFLADQISAATVAWRQQKSGLTEEHPVRFSTNIHFMLSRVSATPTTLARLNDAIDRIKSDGEFQHIADTYALPILIHQTLDTDWFQFLVSIGTVAFALSGVVLAYVGRATLFEAMVLASLPAVGGGAIRDLLFQRQPLGIVRDPFVLLITIGTVLLGMLVIRISALTGAKRFSESLRSRGHLGTAFIQICDGLGLAAFSVIGVVVVLDTSAQPLWLWGPISAGITSSFGGMMRDLLRRDAVAPKLQQELYPEIAVIWGFVFSVFLQWEAERLQPQEIFAGVVVTIVGAFLTRMLAISFRLKGWAYGW
jgi:polar amino acid transport system substrate-binding protein